MSTNRNHSWQEIQERIRGKIRDKSWPPGGLIPGEAALAVEYGCARTTVNRALRELAASGIVDRKRKSGTRVAALQGRRVSADIPVIRTQVENPEGEGAREYRFDLRLCKLRLPPQSVRESLQIKATQKALHTRTIHFANEKPYIYEDRWTNTKTIPEIIRIDFENISINEWLVTHVPFTNGTFALESVSATRSIAKALQIEFDQPILKSARSTWLDGASVTQVNLYYQPGFEMNFEI